MSQTTITQEVFLAGMSRTNAGEDVGVAWLLATARNKLVDHWRARARDDHKLGLVSPPADIESPAINDLGAAGAARPTPIWRPPLRRP